MEGEMGRLMQPDIKTEATVKKRKEGLLFMVNLNNAFEKKYSYTSLVLSLTPPRSHGGLGSPGEGVEAARNVQTNKQ